MRRVSGKSLQEFIADEIASPVSADFSLGAPQSEWNRVAETIPPPAPVDMEAMMANLDPQSLRMRTLGSLRVEFANTPEFRSAELGAVNGTTNARALNRMFAPLTSESESAEKGKALLSAQTMDKICQIQFDGPDLVIMVPLRWGLGYGLPHPETTPSIPQGKIFFHFGWGGAFVLVDTERKLTITYAMNKIGRDTIGSTRSHQYLEAIYKAVQEMK